MGDQRAKRRLPEQALAQVDVIVLGLVRHVRLSQERLRQLIAFLDQATHHVCVQRVSNDEKPILLKTLALFGCYLDELHLLPILPPTA
jgi:hypothetical protein